MLLACAKYFFHKEIGDGSTCVDYSAHGRVRGLVHGPAPPPKVCGASLAWEARVRESGRMASHLFADLCWIDPPCLASASDAS